MKLSDYLSYHDLTDQAFADRVGVDRSTVTRWRNGRMPEPQQMGLIAERTNGDVTPNDFILPAVPPAPSLTQGETA